MKKILRYLAVIALGSGLLAGVASANTGFVTTTGGWNNWNAQAQNWWWNSYSAGYNNGCSAGWSAGFAAGQSGMGANPWIGGVWFGSNYNAGYIAGYQNCYLSGYNQGWQVFRSTHWWVWR